MIKYSKFTDSIWLGNFNDTFCQNTKSFKKDGDETATTTSPLCTHRHTHPRGTSLIVLDTMMNSVKKKNLEYWSRYQSFINLIRLVPGLIESNSDGKQAQEKLWNCKMDENDKAFHKLQIQDPTSGCCSTFLDRKWKETRN